MIPKGVVLFLLVLVLAAVAAVPVTAAKPKRANLVAGTLSKPPAVVNEKAKVSITLRIANKGRKTAGKTRAALYLATSKKRKKSDRRLVRKTVKSLRKGKSTKVKLTATLPASATPRNYRLIVCVDDTKKLKETGEKDNCRFSRVLSLRKRAVTPPVTPPASTPAPRMAATMSTGVDWAFTQLADGSSPQAGDELTATLTAGNALPGQGGYTRTQGAPQPLLTGTTTDLTFADGDDGSSPATLPFAFPFGGVAANEAQVSTNGWLSFGDPAFDYFNDTQTSDYRGFGNVFGRFYRGLMPYFADLDARAGGPAGAGGVKKVVAPGAVAFQWDIGQHAAGGGDNPRRTFQAVLFADGRFRFDYPGTNAPGGKPAFTGYSLGTGPGKLDAVASNVTTVPATSVTYTPKPVGAAAASPAGGTLELILPLGSSFVSADPGCNLVFAPDPSFGFGLVRCGVGAIPPGEQRTKQVKFLVPDDAPGLTTPARFRLEGQYWSDGVLSDDSEISLLGSNFALGSSTLTPTYVAPPTPQVGVESTFTVSLSSDERNLAEPKMDLSLTGANGTIGTVKSFGDTLDCVVRPGEPAPPAGVTRCKLPDGVGPMIITVPVTPTASGAPLQLDVALTAANETGPTTESATSPAVIP